MAANDTSNDVKFIEGDPPPAFRNSVSKRRAEWTPRIQQLRATPGVWAEMMRDAPRKVTATRDFLNKTYGGCSFTARRESDTESVLYGRFDTEAQSA